MPSDSQSVLVILAAVGAAFAALALLFALLGFFAARGAVARLAAAGTAAGRDEIAAMLRRESESLRGAFDGSGRSLRAEVSDQFVKLSGAIQAGMAATQDALLRRTDAFAAADAEAARELRKTIDARLDAAAVQQGQSSHEMREELSGSFMRMRQGVGDEMRQMGEHQKERLEATQAALTALASVHEQGAEKLRAGVELQLTSLRSENAGKLEEMRRTVDEQLQTTLEKRLGESFNRVVEQLNKAYEVFGEMKNISTSVGDLKNVLTNPKLRGTFGEVQLAMLLEDFLAPSQYVKDAQVKDNTGERVEYAIRLPSADGSEVLLPVDAKFPREDHEAMIAAHAANDSALADYHRKELEKRIKLFAKDICRKYINPPRTTERAILFLPTESLFAEVLRTPGLFDHVQRECNVMLAGPTTFAAILHAFQVNHRSMAIAQRSGEIWETLSAVRSEFRRYNDAVDLVAKQLATVSGSVQKLGTRTKQMDRALKKVETMPDESKAALLLGLGDTVVDDDDSDSIGVGEMALLGSSVRAAS